MFSFPRINADIKICREQVALPQPMQVKLLDPNEETGKGPAYYLWDYLRKSKSRGYFLALSGGSDSAAVATMVYFMCKLIYGEIVDEKNDDTLQDLRSIIRDEEYYPKNAEELTSKVFFTAYMPTEHSS